MKHGDEYAKALAVAREELAQRLAEQRETEGRIAWLRATIASLERISEEQPVEDSVLGVLRAATGADSFGAGGAGLTKACKATVEAAGRPVQAAEVVRLLELEGFDVNRYSRILSSVQIVLTRLVERGELRIAETTAGGRPLYASSASNLSAILQPASGEMTNFQKNVLARRKNRIGSQLGHIGREDEKK